MSVMTMYKVPEKGEVEEVKTFRNSTIFGMVIWVEMCERYFHDRSWYTHGESGALWKLAKDPRVSETDRIVLATTFDRVMVKKENFPRLIEAMKKWADVNDGYNHIGGVIECLEELQQDNSCHAVCWWLTSSSDNPWKVRDYDEEDEYDDPHYYDISKADTKENCYHWFLFDELDKKAA